MRGLWSLPKAAPALLHHLAAYAELVALDFSRAQAEIGSIFIAGALAAICGLFCVMLACLAVIGYYWDTPNRVVVIGGMAGGFFLLSIIMVAYARRLMGARMPFLGDLQREWQEDKVILEHALSSDEE